MLSQSLWGLLLFSRVGIVFSINDSPEAVVTGVITVKGGKMPGEIGMCMMLLPHQDIEAEMH